MTDMMMPQPMPICWHVWATVDDGTKELFRRLLQEALQELIDAELTSHIGADRHQRSDSRSNYRNGGRARMLSTPAGDVELRIPKVRVGSFSRPCWSPAGEWTRLCGR